MANTFQSIKVFIENCAIPYKKDWIYYCQKIFGERLPAKLSLATQICLYKGMNMA